MAIGIAVGRRTMASDRGHWAHWVAASLLLAAGTLSAATGAAAHSALIRPLESTWDSSCRIGTAGGRFAKYCPGPCSRYGRRHNYKVETYRRGQNIPVVYSKNNHNGGFLRLTLVPVKHRYHAWAHARNAFRWSCWSAGEVNCPKRTGFECGNDSRGRRYQQWVTIPPVFQDGEYILGFVWYGGGFQQGTYWSCADVRIQGGPLQNTYDPVFVSGQCKSNTNALGQCTRQPCRQAERWGKPREFGGWAAAGGALTGGRCEQ
eukprot:TRINITY_DN14328_c0_g1_i1.p1 TRINITY_DN14328_c0_g1~~TRINITY_DN14328_c0_g1_i1.p1  ORF type:complete len:261 (-),score=27.05 TRINITY_DN14328_c0_g1_i1:35-817(-)